MKALLLYAAAATAVAGGGAGGSVLGVSPVGIERAGKERTAVLTLRNGGSEPLNVQLRVFRWTQVDGEDVLVRTSDIVASPPAAVILPGQRNVVRVVRQDTDPPAEAEAYRLIVDEVPDPEAVKAGTIKMALRQSVPVFFLPGKNVQANLSWQISWSNGQGTLRVTNSGQRPVRLSGVSLTKGEAEIWNKQGLLGYVLGGSTKTWQMAGLANPGPGPVTINATTRQGSVTAQAPVGI